MSSVRGDGKFLFDGRAVSTAHSEAAWWPRPHASHPLAASSHDSYRMMPPRPAAIAVIMMPSPAAPSPTTQTAARDRLREVGGGRHPRPPAALAADVAAMLQLTADDAHLLGIPLEGRWPARWSCGASTCAASRTC